jgi:hypothetical protein
VYYNWERKRNGDKFEEAGARDKVIERIPEELNSEAKERNALHEDKWGGSIEDDLRGVKQKISQSDSANGDRTLNSSTTGRANQTDAGRVIGKVDVVEGSNCRQHEIRGNFVRYGDEKQGSHWKIARYWEEMAERPLSLKKKNWTTQSTDWAIEAWCQNAQWQTWGGEKERNKPE